MNVNLQNRQQLLTVLAAVAVGLWAADRLLYTPLVKAWDTRKARIVALNKEVKQGTQLLAREQAVRERWKAMRANTLPAEMQVAEGRVIKSVYQWSENSRVSVTSTKPQWKQLEDDYSTLECRVDAFGSLATIVNFLHAVEKDPLALKVEAVELTTKENDGSQLTLGLQVSGLQLNPNLR
jgi:Tfp pilus assembly protein PilO